MDFSNLLIISTLILITQAILLPGTVYNKFHNLNNLNSQQDFKKQYDVNFFENKIDHFSFMPTLGLEDNNTY